MEICSVYRHAKSKASATLLLYEVYQRYNVKTAYKITEICKLYICSDNWTRQTIS